MYLYMHNERKKKLFNHNHKRCQKQLNRRLSISIHIHIFFIHARSFFQSVPNLFREPPQQDIIILYNFRRPSFALGSPSITARKDLSIRASPRKTYASLQLPLQIFLYLRHPIIMLNRTLFTLLGWTCPARRSGDTPV